ncbi:MAG: hypothetical protein K9M45_06330 [Kiritimatiellales bacterium]|nr:hypothetical protein [Kiritimatiellales bacterium]
MVKRYGQNPLRQRDLSRFVKDLVRRSRSKCELCGCSGEKLSILEIFHDEDMTDANQCIFVCKTCLEQIIYPKKTVASHWRCLNNAIWSEVPAVQVMAARMLKRLARVEHWAGELLEETYFDSEIKEWAALTE